MGHRVTWIPTDASVRLEGVGEDSVSRALESMPSANSERRSDGHAPITAPGDVDARARRRWPPVENVAPAVIFLLVSICIAADFIDDVQSGHSPLHLAGMVVGTVLSLAGFAMMVRLLNASRARASELLKALDHTRADAIRWHAQAGQMLQGLGALIDEQFAEWQLSPAEREVALLLLKGLSLKEIAIARRASEPTVRQQAQGIYRKADLSGRAELSAFFLEDLLARPQP